MKFYILEPNTGNSFMPETEIMPIPSHMIVTGMLFRLLCQAAGQNTKQLVS